jgi:hypothetical protein
MRQNGVNDDRGETSMQRSRLTTESQILCYGRGSAAHHLVPRHDFSIAAAMQENLR